MKTKAALIIVDVQNDFLPGGALPVPHGDLVIPVINSLQEGGRFDLIVATQDWHPRKHISFAKNHRDKLIGDKITARGKEQILWPEHCVINTVGAQVAPKLYTTKIVKMFKKGTDPEVDSYSAFFDNQKEHSTGLGEYLKSNNVTSVYVVGLATDYCVKHTALDAKSLGFDTCVIMDACRGVELHKGDIEAARQEMRDRGIKTPHLIKIWKARSCPTPSP